METNRTLIENATVLAGSGLEVNPQADLLIDKEQIAAIGPHGTLDRSAATERLDGSGLVLMPGFIDAHVHIGFADPADVVRGGVTSARDLAWPPEIIFPLAQRSRALSFDGPELLAAGPMLTVPGGYPMRAGWAPAGTGRAVTSPGDAEAAVTETAGAGAAVIKFALNPEVGPVLDRPTLEAIVEAAHGAGLKTTGHIFGLDELEKAIAAGVDELAHMLMSPEEIPRPTIDAMVAAGMAVVPTLSVRFGRDRDTAIENLRRFSSAGGTVIYGTDLGNAGPGPGIDVTEVTAMAEAGFGPRELVASATSGAARWLGLTDRGSLTAGLLADIIGVPESALDRAEDLCDVRMVWRRGRRVR